MTELQITASETVAYCHALVKIFDSKVRLTWDCSEEQAMANWHDSYPIELKSDQKHAGGCDKENRKARISLDPPSQNW